MAVSGELHQHLLLKPELGTYDLQVAYMEHNCFAESFCWVGY